MDQNTFVRVYQTNPQIVEQYGATKTPLRLNVENHVKNADTALRKEVIQKIAELVETELFAWERFPINLPSSLFVDKQDGQQAQILDANKLFQAPADVDLVRSLAFDDNGNRKPLTREQMEQVHRTGSFSVPSESFPGKYHVWQLSGLLVKGSEKVKASWYSAIAYSIEHLAYSAPSYFISTDTNVVCLARSLVQLPKLVVDAASILVGIPEQRLWRPLDELLSEKRMQYMFLEFEDQVKEFSKLRKEAFNKISSRSRHQGPLFSGLLQSKNAAGECIELDVRLWCWEILQVVSVWCAQVGEQVVRAWNEERFKIISELLKEEQELLDQGLTHAAEQRVVSKCRNILFSRLGAAFQYADKSEFARIGVNSDNIGWLMIACMQVNEIITLVQQEVAEERTAAEISIANEIKQQHEILGRVPSWLRDQVNQRHQTQCGKGQTVNRYYEIKRYQLLVNRLAEHIQQVRNISTEGNDVLAKYLDQQLYLIRRDYEWQSKKELKHADKVWIKENMKVPSRIFCWSSAIVLPKNHSVIRHEATEYNQEYYELVNREKFYVRSDEWGWRLKIVGVRGFTWFKNNISRLVFELAYGRCSYKALFLVNEYTQNPRVLDTTNGFFSPSPLTHPTIISRVISLWNTVANSRQAFEAQSDTGLLGKGISRIFNVVWNYVFVGGLGTAISVTIIPVLHVAAFIVLLVLLITNIIWSPLSSVLKYLMNALIVDTEHAGSYGMGSCSLVVIILRRVLINFGLNTVSSVLIGLIMHPLLAFSAFTLSSISTAVRTVYDRFIMHTIIKYRARIPLTDSFLARRISGPGFSAAYYYQISAADALSVLRWQMENEELTMFTTATLARIKLPVVNFLDTAKQIGSTVFKKTHLSAITNKVMSQFKSEKLERKLTQLVEERKKKLPNAEQFYQYYSLIRLNPEQLTELLQAAEILITEFVQKHYFNDIFHNNPTLIREYWLSRRVNFDDWKELTKYYLTNSFTSDIMLPLHPDDCTISLQVEHQSSASNYIKMLDKGHGKDDLDVAMVRLERAAREASTELIDRQTNILNNFYLTGYPSTFINWGQSLPFTNLWNKHDV